MRSLLLSVLLLLPLSAQATIDAFEFSEPEYEDRFHDLNQVLRCPKCQNQNISDSDAPLAADLRREVYRMVEEGQSDEQVIDFMVTRYGDFVLYRPRVNSMTWVLWYGPYVLLAIGILVVILISRNRRQRAGSQDRNTATRDSGTATEAPSAPSLNPEEAERLKKLLQRDSDT
jgi:cytochrome c-type biogenesis protein CcmH